MNFNMSYVCLQEQFGFFDPPQKKTKNNNNNNNNGCLQNEDLRPKTEDRRPKNEDPEARPRTNLNVKLQRPKRFIRWQEMRN